MGFWGNFFRGFAKSAVSGLSAGALDEAVRAAKDEIDGLDGASPDERAAMKTGVDFLRQRVQSFVDNKVESI
jgi:hypothetical protein